MNICDKNLCTGCMACLNICPVNAISIKNDEEGFTVPTIDDNKCINCKKCISTCPQISPRSTIEFKQKVYACWHKNSQIRESSTSGGAFTALAERVITNGGVIYGAAIDDQNVVRHICIKEIDMLYKLRGSKYVQSSIGFLYKDIQNNLNKNIPVLFSGTPCQVAGLYSFLGSKNIDNLYTIDIVCHGVPSPKVFSDYIQYIMSKKKDKNIKNIYFRDKTYGWNVFSMKIDFENGKQYLKNTYEDPFIRGFLRQLYLRPSCHDCHYANTNRIADITLSDFWGYQATSFEEQNDDKGISMCMINSEHGDALFNSSKGDLIVWNRTVEEAVNGNPALQKPFLPAKNRDIFWIDYNKHKFSYIVKRYLFEENKFNSKYKWKMRFQNFYDFLIHIPNRIIRAIIGKKRYDILKTKLKGELK